MSIDPFEPFEVDFSKFSSQLSDLGATLVNISPGNNLPSKKLTIQIQDKPIVISCGKVKNDFYFLVSTYDCLRLSIPVSRVCQRLRDFLLQEFPDSVVVDSFFPSANIIWGSIPKLESQWARIREHESEVVSIYRRNDAAFVRGREPQNFTIFLRGRDSIPVCEILKNHGILRIEEAEDVESVGVWFTDKELNKFSILSFLSDLKETLNVDVEF